MRTLVSIDTETGLIRRYSETAGMTHEAGLVSDPADADQTRRIVEGFRAHPHDNFRCTRPRVRTYEDAVGEQIQRRAALEAQNILSHRDEA